MFVLIPSLKSVGAESGLEGGGDDEFVPIEFVAKYVCSVQLGLWL